ncbi:hypothetical protein [Amycolatopsis sp. NPDC004079]|uniref:hypothetical protein n=1 Tax=Amycolatopsis sp. NPDC004079 TaxID=3154549 RepID=UPI0033A50CAA
MALRDSTMEPVTMSNTAPGRGETAAADEQPGAQVPDLFPFARMPLWFMLAGRPLKERAILEFLTAHVNEQTGKLTAYPGIATIGEAVELKSRAVQYAIDALIEFGAIEVVPTYKDRLTGDRTFEPVTDGRSNAQESNTYVPCFSPPGGMLYPGPITLAEWYDERRRADPRKGKYKHLIEKRINAARRREARVRTSRRHTPEGGVHVDAPPIEQGFSEDPEEMGGCTSVHRGGASTCTGGVHVDAPKEDQGEEDQGEDSVRPVADAGARKRAAAHAAADGRTDLSPDHPTPQDLSGGEAAVSSSLLAEQEIADGLKRLDCRPSQRAKLARCVARALGEGHPPDKVRGYLLAKMRETTSKRITFVIRAFDPEHVADLAEAAPAAHADVRSARRAERDRAQPAPPAPTAPPVSPVDWLDDRQFGALTPGERATVNSCAGRSPDQLSRFDQARLDSIQRRVAAVFA